MKTIINGPAPSVGGAPEYPKIETLLNRDEKTFKVQLEEWRLPEFAYLAGLPWQWTEKVDGTNIRIHWNGISVSFGGKTDKAQVPTFLLARLNALFSAEKFAAFYPDSPMTLYGEGFGAKIQRGGKYKADGVDFVLFDVLIEGWWLERPNMEDIASKLGTQTVPLVGTGTLRNAVACAHAGLQSRWGNFQAEGLVVKPEVGLRTRSGHRIIGKIKTKDF